MVALKTISLFTGAGGLDLGLEAAGFDLAIGVECDAEAVATVRANRDWLILDQSIHEIPAPELMRRGGLGEGEADLLVGGPPCQPFSKSGYWHRGDARRLEDPRASTLGAYLKVLRAAKPRTFMLENVPGLAFSTKDEGLLMLHEEIERINRETGTRYTFSAAQLNAVDYGIPQLRERVFIIGDREGREFSFPPVTHARPPRIDMANGGAALEARIPFDLEPPRTAWDAIGHLEDDDDPELAVRGKWADLLPTIPEGQNYLFHTDRGRGHPIFGWRTRYWSMLLKLAKARPAWTLTAQPGPAIGPFHWKNRRLSASELCALQTFPPAYRIKGSVLAAHRQVGNAVPSALSEILGLQIRRQLRGDRRADPTKPTLLPDRRVPVPDPDRVKPLRQRKYLDLVGEHAAHPGTGKGPGARARAQTAGS